METSSSQHDQLDIEHKSVDFQEEEAIDAEDIAERMESASMPIGWLDQHRIRAPGERPSQSISADKWRARQRRAAQQRTLEARRVARRIAVARGPQQARRQTRHRSRRSTRHTATARGPDPDPQPPIISRQTLGQALTSVGNQYSAIAIERAALASPNQGSSVDAVSLMRSRRDHSRGRRAA